jgi:hypothetical protein
VFKNQKIGLLFFTLLLMFLFAGLKPAIADEFVVRSFKAAPNDLSAIQYEFLDVNDEKCAIIKVRTDLRNLSFDSGKNLAKNVEFKDGEFWLYVSPGEKRLTIIKDGFITLHFPIDIPIKPAKVYVLEITNKNKGSAETGSMIINTTPLGAKVIITELSGLDFTTPARLNNYPAFPYSIKILKDRYKTIDTVLTIHPGEEIIHNLELEPRWGDLIIDVNPIDAEIYINNQYLGTGYLELVSEENGIFTGTHTISVMRDKYYTEQKTVEIVRGNNGTLEFNLQPRLGYLGVDVTPADARVFLNGKALGNLPYSDSLLIGTYELTISRDGYRTINKTIELSENQRIDLFEQMDHTRQVRITSKPSGAAIYLRDEYLGTTPENVLLSYGANSITLKKENFEDLEQRVEVTGSTDGFELELEPAKYYITINTSPQGADVYFNNRLTEVTPLNLWVDYGTYRLKLEKYGFFRKRKTINVSFNNQTFNFQLSPLRHVRLGVVRSPHSWGGEITYVEDLFGLTIGYFQPPKKIFEPGIDHENIIPEDYYNLNPGSSVGTESNGDSLSFKIIAKGHIFLNKLPTFSFVLGMAMGKIHYSDVYVANADFEHTGSGETIYQGEYYSVAGKGNFKISPITGISLRILRYFYVGAEYWFLTEKDTQLFLNGGVCFPLR